MKNTPMRVENELANNQETFVAPSVELSAPALSCINDEVGEVIEGVCLMDDALYEDERGHLIESYQSRRLAAEIGESMDFVQDNLSYSKQGVLRGLHYQYEYAQAKLVRVLAGAIWDVVVDLRQSSPSFGQWGAYRLQAGCPQQLYVPAGCAHGFLTLSESSLVLYKVSDFYQAQDQYCLRYDDPKLNIMWPLVQAPILSEKDAQGLAWGKAPLFA